MVKNQIDGTLLLTGAAGGTCEEIAYAFAEAGAAGIVLADINNQKGNEVAEKSKALASYPEYRTLVVAVDLTDHSSVKRLVDSVVKEFERIDYNVNAAGIDNSVHEAIYDSLIDEYDNVMNVNARAVMLCTRAVSKVILAQEYRSVKTRHETRNIGRGLIVNIGSANSYAALPGKFAYVTSKHAMMGTIKTAALDYASEGVRVNAVCPSWVRTPMVEAECGINPSLEGAIKTMSPLGRAAEPEEVAGVVLFLSGPDASYVTGTGLVINTRLTLTVHLT